jgi:ribosomal protein S18 acetylase RimI-like enzyme
MTLRVVPLTGGEIAPALPALARLRIAVFRDWPYLYDGSLGYEEKHLAKLAAANGAIVVAACDGESIVGCATAAPMAEMGAELAEPFRQRGMDIGRIYYCGESVLLPAWRGQGLGRRLIEITLAAAAGRFEQVDLDVYGQIARALALYRSVGFVEQGRKRGGRKLDGVYDDIVLMTRFLTEPK